MACKSWRFEKVRKLAILKKRASFIALELLSKMVDFWIMKKELTILKVLTNKRLPFRQQEFGSLSIT